MFRIDSPGATVDNKFTNGNPALGIPATDVSDEWLNSIQEELAYTIEQSGITLNKASTTQLNAALNSRIVAAQSIARYIYKFNGTGSQTAFTLGVSAPSTLAVAVWVGGTSKIPTVDYTVSGQTITFTSAPASGTDNIVVTVEGSAQEVVSQFSTGMYMAYAAATAPAGWLLCDGSAVSRTTYGNLFALIGTSYGSGNGTTTFNVPDLRGRALFGMDNLGGSAANRITTLTTYADSINGRGGAATVTPTGTVGDTTLTLDQIPSHSHSSIIMQTSGGNLLAYYSGSTTILGNGSTGSVGGGQSHTHTLSINAISVLPPYMGAAMLIKT